VRSFFRQYLTLGAAGRVLRRLLLAALALAGVAGSAHAQREGALVVRKLSFDGNHALTGELLAASIATTNSAWLARTAPFRWIGLGEKRFFNQIDFERDVYRIEVLYKKSGYPDVRVDTTVRRTTRDIYLNFRITEGQPILVKSFQVTGLDSIPAQTRAAVTVDLPMAEGDVFSRIVMQAAADTIGLRLENRGYPSADVLVSYIVRTEEREASVTLDVLPGHHAVVGSVDVEGTQRTTPQTVVSLLTARPGEDYSRDDLFQSQRNLYNSDLFRLASVSLDTSRFVPGSDSVPLLVQVAEAMPRRARASVGYGTTDCLRGSAGVTFRNFLGAGRLLDLSSRVAKIGVGTPLDWGLDKTICEPLQEDTIGSSKLNYNFTAALRRPAFLSPNNTAVLSAYVERRSEFKVYRRQEVGASMGINRETPVHRLPVSLTYTVSVGRTEASPVNFCAFFNACNPSDIAFLSQRRRLATLSALGSVPRANNPIDPTRGYVASGEVTVASRFVGSDPVEQFTRLVGDLAWYHPIGRDIVFSWHVHGGAIFSPVKLAGSPVSFVPPDERFYAGGPNDVRGFPRNQMGPVVYVANRSFLESTTDTARLDQDSVRIFPVGGNTLAVANMELRLPSPVFTERMRLAVFVDAGTMWERGVTSSRLVVTPGFGLRIATPLGPARLDLAYNPRGLAPGSFYIVESDNTLTRDPTRTAYKPPGHSYALHFAVGQPF
jgi:outer membrane protein assembly factor BamA